MTVRAPTEHDSQHVKLILAIRQARGWTQLDLGQHLSLSVSTIANWESGRKDPHPMWLNVLRGLLPAR